ncbi:glycosyltransferase family 4 protein [Bacillus alveayuensis]|uniref:glycosyltransferase family 4 protein n=1 Tax=Aeribacillus alveayuensis TaxID=279215 RepID=UPI0005D13321|nr:glycosyltransferase family 4 protein [Bacillus alveayuensis]
MKILIVSNMYPDQKDPVYGIFVKEQVDRLQSLGVNIDKVILTKNNGNKLQSLIKYLKLWGNSIYQILKNDYDIVHVHYIFPTAAFIPIIKKFTKSKLVGTIHGTKFLEAKSFKYKYIKKIFSDLDHIITVSEFVKSNLKNVYNISDDKISVISCGVDRSLFKPQDKMEAKKNIGVNPDKKLITYIGRLHVEKGIKTLIEIIKYFEHRKDIEFVIIGNGPEMDYLQSTLKNNESVRVYCGKPKRELPIWFNASDIFIFPTKREAFGLVALESISCKTPVIASKIGGVKEIIDDGINGFLVEPDNASAFIEKTKELLDNEEIYNYLISNCEDKAKDQDINKQVKRIYNLYSKLLESWDKNE